MSRSSVGLRRQLVEELSRGRELASEAVRAAFLTVPRERFVPEIAAREGLTAVYEADRPLVLKTDAAGLAISSSSAPRVMAPMLEHLDLAPGMSVLEIGTGSGYNAALLSVLVGPSGRVTSVEVDPELVGRARRLLRAGGYRVRVVCADGREGWAPGAPYDRIVCTASSPSVPRAYYTQLAAAGLVEVPLHLSDGSFLQIIPALRKRDGGLASTALVSGGFMALRDPGAGGRDATPCALALSEVVAGRARVVARLAGPGVGRLGAAARRRVLALIAASPRRHRVAPRTKRWALTTFLGLTGGRALVDYVAGETFGAGLVDARGTGLALLVGPPGEVRALLVWGDAAPEARLRALVDRWDQLGRPEPTDLRVRISYGGAPSPRAWRTQRRGDSTIAYSWVRSGVGRGDRGP